MPRAPRVEFEGALYHVLCRGDRREPIFVADGDRELFLKTLGQACGRTGFVVHAFALMDNHYHLMLETPAGNLVEGMRWFQTTYTARFNARHRLSGHLFQGRYKALLIEPDATAYGRTVADYIHLNPIRAGIVRTEEELSTLAWSSYRHYASGKGFPKWLRVGMVYGDLGLNEGRVADRRRFRRYMCGRIVEELEGRDRPREVGDEAGAWAAIRRGWVLGSDAFRGRMEELVSGKVQGRKRESYAGDQLLRHDQGHAKRLLDRSLARLGLELGQVRAMKKSDVRKQAVAWLLKSQTSVGNDWIRDTLQMGDRSNVNRAMRRFELSADRESNHLKKILQQCPD